MNKKDKLIVGLLTVQQHLCITLKEKLTLEEQKDPRILVIESQIKWMLNELKQEDPKWNTSD